MTTLDTLIANAALDADIARAKDVAGIVRDLPARHTDGNLLLALSIAWSMGSTYRLEQELAHRQRMETTLPTGEQERTR